MTTILIVDDEPEVVRISRGYLEQAGYKVLDARDGTAALAEFRQNCDSYHKLTTIGTIIFPKSR